MRRSLNDKVITIRFNYLEKKVLEYLLNNYSKYYDEPTGSYIKRILFEEYKRKTGKSNFNDLW